jgi:hypothetical protein
MVEIRIYAEGGGEGDLLDTLFRKGWKDFFESAGLRGSMPRIIRGKTRSRTFDLFKTAVTHRTPGTLPLLLVDSEGPIHPGHTVWQHLKAHDNWDPPPEVSDDQAFLMVEIMETWFLADRAALRDYFGPNLRENAFPTWPALESVPKVTIQNVLQAATANCKTKYAKGRVSFELLSKLNPADVEQRCSHAQRLLNRLRNT